MKKSLVALAVLAAAGAASAQSSVTLFGIVDAAVSYQSATTKSYSLLTIPGYPFPLYTETSNKQSNWALRNSGYNSSRIGFRGVEDLGGGLAASFWLEAPITNDDGATGISTFARRSTVSLSGGFGEIRLGRDYTPTFWNDTIFDPFGTNGSGTNVISTVSGGVVGSNYVRASNSIGYFLPKNLGGFYGQFMYSLHENIKNSALGSAANPSTAGKYIGGRFGYANGPLDVAFAYGESTKTDSLVNGTFLGLPIVGNNINKAKIANLGASYDFGPVKLMGELSRTTDNYNLGIPVLFGNNNVKDKYNGYLIGVTAPIGAGLIRASYSRVDIKEGGLAVVNPFSPASLFFTTGNKPKVDKFAIGYVHNLSKRTALYATAAWTKNKNDQNYIGGLQAAATNVYGGKGPGFGVYDPVTGARIGNGFPGKAIGYDFGIRHAF